MNKKIIFGICVIVIIVSFIIIKIIPNNDNDINTNKVNNLNNESESDNMKTTINIKITINNKTFIATLEDNETANEFIKLLPQEYTMNELNNNEKYIYLDYSLPTNPYNPKHIDAGDIMLYGNNCLVLFYKSFDTNYSYTKIGHIDNLSDLDNDNVIIKFER